MCDFMEFGKSDNWVFTVDIMSHKFSGLQTLVN